MPVSGLAKESLLPASGLAAKALLPATGLAAEGLLPASDINNHINNHEKKKWLPYQAFTATSFFKLLFESTYEPRVDSPLESLLNRFLNLYLNRIPAEKNQQIYGYMQQTAG